MSSKVLVVAAHPDDEVLGVGGTVAKHVAAGDTVTLLVVVAGALIHDADGSASAKTEAKAAARALGVTDLRLLDFPDQRLDTLCLVDVISSIENAVEDVKPQIAYIQWGGDINKDHKLLFEAALVALRPVEGFLDEILSFDTVSSTDWGYPRNFVPDTWIDVSGRPAEAKLAALECYASEMRPFPHPRSLKSIEAKMTATGAQVCVAAAEAFMTIRRIVR